MIEQALRDYWADQDQPSDLQRAAEPTTAAGSSEGMVGGAVDDDIGGAASGMPWRG
jgi:hypothetical protein